MESLTALNGQKLCIDSQILIYTVELHTLYGRSLWQEVEESQLAILISELALLEVLVLPYRIGDPKLQSDYKAALDSPSLQIVPITTEVLLRAAQLRAHKPTLRTPDAIHAATALCHSCDCFLTNDAGFRGISGLRVYLLDDLVRMS